MDAPRPPQRGAILFGVYAVLMLATSALAFGTSAIAVGCLILVAWGYIFLHPRRDEAFWHVMVLLAIGMLICLLLPAVQSAREVSRRTSCKNNVKQIGLALHNYHDRYGSFPPPYTVGADGRPLHSWRVLILPYLDEIPLYNRFRLDEPWNSPHNIDVGKEMPDVYACPSREPPDEDLKNRTSYVAVVGDGTMWPGDGQSRQLSDVSDAASNTILVIESDCGITWYEPRDLSLDEAFNQLADAEPIDACGHRARDYFYDRSYGRHAALVDGSVYFVRHGVGRDTWLQLLLIDDGGFLLDDWYGLRIHVPGTERPRYANWFRLGIFLLVTLLPLPWVWRNPTSGRNDSRPQIKPAPELGDRTPTESP